ncbi:hypothetical protein [uncultured Rikenella sp.]|uniref:hypothetical protein n=1 Tax=uncultured Rikenella sp. TaxID=368003 RepID=UPI0025DE34F4|nr:hypothetical protein [uncultured Rikenella sp.]
MIFAGHEPGPFEAGAAVVGMSGTGVVVGVVAGAVLDGQADRTLVMVVRQQRHDQQQEQGPAQKGYGGLSFHVVGASLCKDRNYSSNAGGCPAPGIRDAGYRGTGGGSVYFAGNGGYSWSSKDGETGGTGLVFGAGWNFVSYVDYRGLGLQLRCLSE